MQNDTVENSENIARCSGVKPTIVVPKTQTNTLNKLGKQ